MILVDDILLLPFHGILWIFREVQHAAEEETANEAEAITARLGDIYMMLETGQMTSEEFDDTEKALLDRLDSIKHRTAGGEEGQDEEGLLP